MKSPSIKGGKSLVDASELDEKEEENRRKGLKVFTKVVNGMSFGRRLSNLEKMRRDTS